MEIYAKSAKFMQYSAEPLAAARGTLRFPGTLVEKHWSPTSLHFQHSLYAPTLSLYARNSASMGRIDQSHAQIASGATTGTHFVISRPGTN